MTWNHFFVAGAVYTLDRWTGKMAVRGHQLCTQLSILEGSLAEFFVFDVVNFEK